MTSLQDYLKALCFYLLAWRPHCFAYFSLFVFCRGKLVTTSETTVTWTRRSLWFLTWLHDPFRNPDPFMHWFTVNFIGHDSSGQFKARYLGVKILESIFFFLRIPFYTLLSYHNYKNPVGRLDTYSLKTVSVRVSFCLLALVYIGCAGYLYTNCDAKWQTCVFTSWQTCMPRALIKACNL